MKFFAPNLNTVEVPFTIDYDVKRDASPSFVSKRMDFDNFLIEEVKQRKNIEFIEGVSIEDYVKIETGYRLKDKSNSLQIETKLLILADGAHSIFARHHAGLEKDPRHHAGAVRAYFEGVRNLHPDNFIELHFIKDVAPGYFWIFPLPNNGANVGLGMRSDHISDRKYNLRKSLLEVIENNPTLKKRFKGAKLVGKVTGYGLPFGSKKRKRSGDHFMLIGDAAHLVDPLTGEGIGNGIYSGFIAAEQAAQCIEANDFSAVFLKTFDQRIIRVLGGELKVSYQLQRLLRYGWLVNLLIGWASRNEKVLHTIVRMFTDLNLRKQVFFPKLWLKLLLGKQP
jgi:flavin-dependent dehydrogenase